MGELKVLSNAEKVDTEDDFAFISLVIVLSQLTTRSSATKRVIFIKRW